MIFSREKITRFFHYILPVMLVKLEIENFRSFNQKQTFHAVQRNYKRFNDHIYDYKGEFGILKTSGVYGGNASGKTNLFKGLYVVKKMVEDPEYLETMEASKYFAPFRLNTESVDKPSKFSIEFIHEDILYLYQLSVNHSTQIVVNESLFYIDENNTEIKIFQREQKNEENITIEFSDSRNEQLLAILKDYYLKNPYMTFISNDLINDRLIVNARNWFNKKVKFLFPTYEFKDIAYILSLKEEYLMLANRIIEFSRTGIHKLRLDKIPIEVYFGSGDKSIVDHIKQKLEKDKYYSFQDNEKNYVTAIRNKADNSIVILKLITIHLNERGDEVIFDIDQESRGSIVLINLLPALILSYGEGVNYFVDEINRSLHPILIREILAQYLKNDIAQAKGQLFFNSHEDFMIDESIVRQDEIWLMELNKKGESELFPLSDYRNVRHDLNLRKNYLDGKFGGVPFESKPDKLTLNVKA